MVPVIVSVNFEAPPARAIVDELRLNPAPPSPTVIVKLLPLLFDISLDQAKPPPPPAPTSSLVAVLQTAPPPAPMHTTDNGKLVVDIHVYVPGIENMASPRSLVEVRLGIPPRP